MAEVVQLKLERMLPELEDLEQRRLFSRQELAEIVKKRRDFEYRLKRHSPLKEDFLAYIDYEKQLDALRSLRKKASQRKSGEKSKNSRSDHSGVTRILDIYRLATTRFKGDIELWFQYLEFCKARGHGRMKKALAQLVRFHPKVPGVWLYAAAWEFDRNLNVAAARALMQNGLRSCPNSEDLWVEYLRMELTYLNKLKARKIALGEDKGNVARGNKNADEQQWRDENQDLFMSLNENGDADKNSGESEEKGDVFREYGLNFLDTIYSSAVEALPTAFSLRTRFLAILESTELVNSEEMRNKILNEMKIVFSKEPQYWDWLARIEIADSKGVNSVQLGKAVQVYEEGLKFVPSPIMAELYLKFLMEAENRDGEAVVHLNSDTPAVKLVSHIQEVFEKAESLGCISEAGACQHVSYLMHLGKLVEAKELTKKLCSGKFQDAVNIWTLRLTIEIRCMQNKTLSPSKADLLSIFELLKNILMKLNVSEAEDLWTMGLKYFANQRHYFGKLVEMSVPLLARDGGNDSGFSLSSTIINFILQTDGIQSAREMYKRFLALPHPGLAQYRHCIELESNLAFSGDKTGVANARKLYKSAVATYDQDSSLWRDYHSLELTIGTSETAAAVHWRARKTLKNNTASRITQHSSSLQNHDGSLPITFGK